MKIRAATIEFLSALPPRDRAADAAEVSRIFGGCAGYRVLCQADNNCCPAFTCFLNRCASMSM